MGLFDIFRKRKKDPRPAPAAAQPVLPTLSYRIAYYLLPHYAFNEANKLIEILTSTTVPGGPFFYLMGCQAQKTEPVEEDARRFRVHHGQLDREQDYFVLEYPTPPPVDFSEYDPVEFIESPPEPMPVLAPYFSAVLRHRQTSAITYYTLGQAPIGGGTTLRSVTPEGANCNLGTGPEPQLDAFLARLRKSG